MSQKLINLNSLNFKVVDRAGNYRSVIDDAQENLLILKGNLFLFLIIRVGTVTDSLKRTISSLAYIALLVSVQHILKRRIRRREDVRRSRQWKLFLFKILVPTFGLATFMGPSLGKGSLLRTFFA